MNALGSVDPIRLSGLRVWDLGEGLTVESLVLLLEDPGPALVIQGSNLLLALGFRHCTSSAKPALSSGLPMLGWGRVCMWTSVVFFSFQACSSLNTVQTAFKSTFPYCQTWSCGLQAAPCIPDEVPEVPQNDRVAAELCCSEAVGGGIGCALPKSFHASLSKVCGPVLLPPGVWVMF